MEREWQAEDLTEHWTLAPSEHEARRNKSGAGRLGFTVLLRFFELLGRFPRTGQETPAAVVEYIAAQVGVETTVWGRYAWDGSTVEYHRAQIRELLGFREATLAEAAELTFWLGSHVLPRDRALERVREIARERYRELRIEPPTADQLDRTLRSVIHNHEVRFCAAALKGLSAESRTALDALVSSPGGAWRGNQPRPSSLATEGQPCASSPPPPWPT